MDSFFGIGLFELVLIAIIALVVMGPERLPGAMREVAKYMRQLRQVSNEFQSQFSEELQLLDEINPKRILNDTINPPPPKQPLKPPTAKSAAQPGRATLPTAATTTAAAATAVAATGAEPVNSILPPKPAPAAPQAAAQNGAALPEATVTTASSQDAPSQGTPSQDVSSQDVSPRSVAPTAAEDGP